MGIEGREMDQLLDSSLSAGLGYHPCSFLVHLTELEVPGGEGVGREGGEGDPSHCLVVPAN